MTASIQNFLENNKKSIIAEYHKMKSCRSVGRKFGFSQVAIWKFLKQNEIETPRKKLSKLDEEKLIDAYKNKNLSIIKLSKIFKISYAVTRNYLAKNGVNTNKTYEDYHPNRLNFDLFDKLNEEDCWLLGWFYSDGNVYKSRLTIAVHEKDEEVLFKMQKIVNNNNDNIVFDAPGRRIKILRFHSKELARKIIKLGCIPNKSLILRYPDFFSDEQNWWFLRGVFEGDGCLSLKKQNLGAYCEIASGSRIFLEEIGNFLFKNLNINTCIKERANSNSKRLIILGGIKNIEKFMDALYLNAPENLRLNRKYQIYLKMKEMIKN